MQFNQLPTDQLPELKYYLFTIKDPSILHILSPEHVPDFAGALLKNFPDCNLFRLSDRQFDWLNIITKPLGVMSLVTRPGANQKPGGLMIWRDNVERTGLRYPITKNVCDETGGRLLFRSGIPMTEHEDLHVHSVTKEASMLSVLC